MKTIRVISNISYNTPIYLQTVIESMIKRSIIDWAYWIYHKADIDEQKDHAHIVLKPSSRVDTAELKKLFDELDPSKPDKPLSVTSKWNYTTSIQDWLLYAVHDRNYLASKGQERNIHYSYEDIKSTDYDALKADWNAIDRRKFDVYHTVYNAVANKIPFHIIAMQGAIPIAQYTQYEKIYNALMEDAIKANGGRKTSHEVHATEQDSQNIVVDNDGVIVDGFTRDDEVEI